MRITARPVILFAVAALAFSSCSRTLNTQVSPGPGTLAVQLSDVAFLVEDVRRADIFVVRIDARFAGADSASAGRGAPDDSASSGGWTTILIPNTLVNLLDYQHRVTLPLGSARVAAGTYRGFRLVIDPSRSSLTLVNGAVLTSTSQPSRSIRGSVRSGIAVFLARPLIVREGRTTTVRIDFAADELLTERGAPIANSVLVFRPVLRGTAQFR